MEREEERNRQKEQDKLMGYQKTRQRKMTNYNHRGYDFSGAAGHDVLIMDSLIGRMQSAILDHIKTPNSKFNNYITDSGAKYLERSDGTNLSVQNTDHS